MQYNTSACSFVNQNVVHNVSRLLEPINLIHSDTWNVARQQVGRSEMHYSAESCVDLHSEMDFRPEREAFIFMLRCLGETGQASPRAAMTYPDGHIWAKLAVLSA
jgi:hypothetical protein